MTKTNHTTHMILYQNLQKNTLIFWDLSGSKQNITSMIHDVKRGPGENENGIKVGGWGIYL